MASKEKPVRVTIPATIEKAQAALEGLGALLTAKSWERAATVYAFTVVAEGKGKAANGNSAISLTPEQFAALGIHGLRSHHTVRLYHERWAEHGKKGIKPGQTVTLPTIEWPPTRTGTDGYGSEAGLATTIKRAVDKHGEDTVVRAVTNVAPKAAAAFVQQQVEAVPIRPKTSRDKGDKPGAADILGGVVTGTIALGVVYDMDKVISDLPTWREVDEPSARLWVEMVERRVEIARAVLENKVTDADLHQWLDEERTA
jgi:hypothetical protein